MEKRIKHKDVRKLIKQNEFRDVLSRAWEYAKNNSENIIIYAVIAVVIVVAIPLYLKHRSETEIKAAQLLSRADYYINRPVIDEENATMYGAFRTKEEKYSKIEGAYSEVINTYGGTKSLAGAYVGIADAYYNEGKDEEALKNYNIFIEKFPKHMLLPEALSGRAYVYYRQGKFEKAAAGWKRVVEEFSGFPQAPDAEFQLAVCFLKMGKKEEAKKLFMKIAAEKPSNYRSGAAEEKLEKIN